MGSESSRYTLGEAAERLGVPKATLRFWVEAFGDDLGIARDWRGEPEFSDSHLAGIREIQRMVLDDGLPLAAVRERLRSADREGPRVEPARNAPAPGRAVPAGPTAPARPTVPAPGPPPGREVDTANGTADPAESGLYDAVASLANHIETLRGEIREACRRLDDIGAEIQFLVDENRGLQELIGKLIQQVERSIVGSEQTEAARAQAAPHRPAASPAPTPAAPDNPAAAHGGRGPSDIGPVERGKALTPRRMLRRNEPDERPEGFVSDRPLIGKARIAPSYVVRPWAPDELGPPVARRALARFAC